MHGNLMYIIMMSSLYECCVCVCVSFGVKMRHNFYPVVAGGGDVRVYMCEQQLQYSTALSKPLCQSSSSAVTPADKETSVLLPSSSASASHGNLPSSPCLISL